MPQFTGLAIRENESREHRNVLLVKGKEIFWRFRIIAKQYQSIILAKVYLVKVESSKVKEITRLTC